MPEQEIAAKASRVAIYTRKSVEDRDDVRFTSPEAQRRCCVDFIGERTRKGDNWVTSPALYFEDYACSGGNMDRPSLQRLITAVKSGLLDIVIVYSLDRLNRSVKDFTELQGLFAANAVSYYSVLERYDGTAPYDREFIEMIQMSVAQRQRKESAVKVRDKLSRMAADGMRIGGSPFIGLDIVNKAWVPNESERRQALDQFTIYLKTKSLSATVHALNAKGYRMKKWVSRNGETKGGKLYSKSALYNLLRNPVYIGKIRYAGKLSDGLHPAIIPKEIYDEAQKVMTANGEGHDSISNGRAELWLKGKLSCTACQSAMTPTWSRSKGREYLYYECTRSRSLGKALCPVRRVSADQIHRALLGRLDFLGSHPRLVKGCLAEAERQANEGQVTFESELERVRKDLAKVEHEGQNLAEAIAGGSLRDNPFIQKKLEDAAERRTQLLALRAKLEMDSTSKTVLPQFQAFQGTLKQFACVMQSIRPEARKELAALLIREVVYDEANKTVTASIYPLPELPEVTLGIIAVRVTDDRVS